MIRLVVHGWLCLPQVWVMSANARNCHTLPTSIRPTELEVWPRSAFHSSNLSACTPYHAASIFIHSAVLAAFYYCLPLFCIWQQALLDTRQPALSTLMLFWLGYCLEAMLASTQYSNVKTMSRFGSAPAPGLTTLPELTYSYLSEILHVEYMRYKVKLLINCVVCKY